MDYVRSDSPACEVASTELAACLATLGIPLDPRRPWRRLSGDSEAVSFFFGQGSACGAFPTRAMVARWDDHEWQRNRPRHPLSYTRLYFRNLARYRDWERGHVSIGAIRRAAKIELITLIEGRPVRGEHNPLMDGPSVETEDLGLAMALLTLGISPAPGHRWDRSARRFRFMACDPEARFHAAPLALAWQQAEWWSANPDHPLSYLYCAAGNKAFLLDSIRRAAPVAVITGPTGFPAFLSTAASDEAQARFFRALED